MFKETLKNKNKGKHRFSIVKALSNYEKNENKKNPNSPYITKKIVCRVIVILTVLIEQININKLI